MSPADSIRTGDVYLGIELGSTRIKSVLVDSTHVPIASGAHDWTSRLENGNWTYSLDEVWQGIQHAVAGLYADAQKSYGVALTKLSGFGVSAMMHGYLAFDAAGKLLAPFRTWRNTSTEAAAMKLTDVLHFNIPQRWSVAHLYQAILNKESHVKNIAFLTTLAGYVHWQLTGEKVIGVGDAAGMFPIDSATGDFDAAMLDKFDALVALEKFDWKIRHIWAANIRMVSWRTAAIGFGFARIS
jgi:sugar (pentulose or hexulose) kinase